MARNLELMIHKLRKQSHASMPTIYSSHLLPFILCWLFFTIEFNHVLELHQKEIFFLTFKSTQFCFLVASKYTQFFVQSLVCIDKDESRNIFTDITSIFLVDFFSFSNLIQLVVACLLEQNGSNAISWRVWLQCVFAIYAVCMFSLLCLVGRKKHLCLWCSISH